MMPLLALVAVQVASPEKMLADIDAVRDPYWKPERSADPAYKQEYLSEFERAAARRGELIFAFYRAHPRHPEAPKLLERRWREMLAYGNAPAEVLQKGVNEMQDVLRRANAPEVDRTTRFFLADYQVRLAKPNAEGMLAAVDAFAKRYPKDSRGAGMLFGVADEAKPLKQRIYTRIAREYPSSREARLVRGLTRQEGAVGKPFTFAFTELTSGERVDTAALRGKVVVVDFWATWCGPCIAELPKLRELYARRKADGLEIVGVSLDDAGSEKALKAFVAKNAMAWPQWFQGNGVSSAFTTDWGVYAIPALFLIDRKGVLRDVNGREDLERKVDALLRE